MYKKTKIIIASVLVISCFTAFNINSGKKAESLTPTDKFNNVSLLADPNSENNPLKKDATEQIMGDYSKIAENDNLELYLNETNLGLKIRNKVTGYVWNSGLDYRDKNLNQTWQGFAESAVTIEYMDNKNKVGQLSLTTEKAKTKVIKKASGFTADISFDKRNIKLTLDVTLDKDSISVKVPFSSIEETNDNYKVQSVYVYPFFGAVKGNEIPGYMFIPDGSGALVSLDKKTIASQPYIGKVYGEDLGVNGINNKVQADGSLPPQQIYMPVFGLAHNNNGFVAEIEGGAPYAEIRSYPAGITTAFNWISARFSYRNTYFQPIDKKGNGVTLNEQSKNNFDASIKYMFLSNDDASYVGMAKRYQKDLVDDGILKQLSQNADKDLPIKLEFVAAENKKEFLWKKLIPMTTLDQMNSILKDLEENKVNNMSVTVRGWTKGGITGASPSHFPFESKVGSSSQWESFIKDNASKGIPIYMYTDYMRAYNSSKGFKKSDIAQTISEQLISFGDIISYLNPYATSRLFSGEAARFNQYGISNIAMDSIGEKLNSAYNSKNTLSRSDAIKTYETMFSSNTNEKYALYSPNDYLWKYTNEYLNTPMYSSNFTLESEEVPFIQMVLKGYVNYYAPPSNFYANAADMTLKMIDYGCLPSFDITNEDPVKLLDTDTQWLYTSQYSVWKNEILREYEAVNKALKPVQNAEIKDRKVVAEGVVVNTYSNGVAIAVNYSSSDYNYNGTKVPAENFAVIGRD